MVLRLGASVGGFFSLRKRFLVVVSVGALKFFGREQSALISRSPVCHHDSFLMYMQRGGTLSQVVPVLFCYVAQDVLCWFICGY